MLFNMANPEVAQNVPAFQQQEQYEEESEYQDEDAAQAAMIA